MFWPSEHVIESIPWAWLKLAQKISSAQPIKDSVRSSWLNIYAGTSKAMTYNKSFRAEENNNIFLAFPN
jgi:hypothetical protein